MSHEMSPREALSEFSSYSSATEPENAQEPEDDDPDNYYVIGEEPHRLKKILYLPFDPFWETTLIIMGILDIIIVICEFANGLQSRGAARLPTKSK